MGGYGLEGSDPTLHDKIAALKQKRKSSKDRVNDFLENEIHVDPRDLPFSLDAANSRINAMMSDVGAQIASIHGNSMGLKSVTFATSDYPDIACPSCGSTQDGYWRATRPPAGTGTWFCYDCETESKAPLPDTTVCTATDNDHAGQDWHDLQRCWKAFTGALKYPDPCPKGEEQRTVYSFRAQLNHYGTMATTEALEAPAPEPDIYKYPTGATLRIRRSTFNNGDVNTQEQYVRVGGLFNDNDIVNLDSMQPIPAEQVPGWLVVEEL